MSGGKRRMNDQSETDYSDEYGYDSDNDCQIQKKISNNNISNNRIKQYNSTDHTKQFQNYSVYSKMAMSSENEFRNKTENKGIERRRKCFTKNALMARENRLKKKLYVENLESTIEVYKNENKRLSSLLNNQSHQLLDMKKEIQYFKNVLANSKDISKLLRCINQNTGMSVTTSVNKNMALIGNENGHPWSDEESKIGEFCAPSYDLKSDYNWDTLFSDFNSPLMSEPPNPEDISPISNELEKVEDVEPLQLFDEHNYTVKRPEEASDVGICLHISQHKVSLEFCSTCSEKATKAWEEV